MFRSTRTILARPAAGFGDNGIEAKSILNRAYENEALEPTPVARDGMHIVMQFDDGIDKACIQITGTGTKLQREVLLNALPATISSFNGNEEEIVDSLFEDGDVFPFPNYLMDPLTSSVQYAELLDPTPIASVGMRIVPKVDIEEVWSHDESNKELIKLLLRPFDEDSLEEGVVISDNTPRSSFTRRNEKATRKTRQDPSTKDQKADSWDVRMKELIQYRKQYGHCSVPHNWIGNKALAQFVKRQRYQGKLKRDGRHCTLTDERIQALEDIGFVWSSHAAAWEEKFHALQAFAKQHGHCNVPSRFPAHPKLSVWVRCQRRQYKVEQETYHLNPLTLSRFNRLQSIGFDFYPRI